MCLPIPTKEQYVAKCKKVHGDKYGYDKVDYKGSSEKVIVTCPMHGDFSQLPTSHSNGAGCPKCGKEKRYKTILRKKGDAFVARAKEKHGDKYGYDKVDYKGSLNKVIITCPLHGDFSQGAFDHLRGHGCRKCGFARIASANKNATHFYIWQEVGSNRYKIGITGKSTKQRMTSTSNKLNVTPKLILDLEIKDAFSLEQMLLSIFAENVYDGEGYGIEFLTLTDEELAKLLNIVAQVRDFGVPDHLLIRD